VAKIKVQQTEITVIQVKNEDYISLTDIAKYKSDDPAAVIGNWLRNRNTIEYLGLWEILYNPGFKPLEFEGFRRQAGLNAFTLSPQKWTTRNCSNCAPWTTGQAPAKPTGWNGTPPKIPAP
jgi:hypothetical protein